MPSKSEKQAKLMAAACKDPEYAKKVGIDQKVACEYYEADKKLAEEKEKKRKKDSTGTESHPSSQW